MSFSQLPLNYPDRSRLHDEIHSRPAARLRLPVFVAYVVVFNANVSVDDEWKHLCRLPKQEGLERDTLNSQFLRLRWQGCLLRWERHTEFTRYTLVQALTHDASQVRDLRSGLLENLHLPSDWLANLPGQTLSALQLVMLSQKIADNKQVVEQYRPWFGGRTIVASGIGNTEVGRAHSIVLSDLCLGDNGWSNLLVLVDPNTSETRTGRVAQRVLEIETYRLLALLALPVAKELSLTIGQSEQSLVAILEALERHATHTQKRIPKPLTNQLLEDKALLNQLVILATDIEKNRARYGFRFAASRAYTNIVQQRLGELRERQIDGFQTLGEFLQRRFSPAIATIETVGRRLEHIAARVDHASDLLRTRVTIETESQNQELLTKLNQGQLLQLKLQSTVEGLSIAAISYYIVSLIFYASKGLKNFGLPIHPEMVAGLSIPLVLLLVWRIVERIHKKLHP